MSSEQRWMINDALGLLLQLSRSCCLAPVRFVKIRTDTFIYLSRPLLLFSVIITSILHLYTIYLLYLVICSAERGHYNEIYLVAFNTCLLKVFVSYAVVHSGTRVKNYMTCLTKIKQAIRGLQSSEEINIKKWHVLTMFIIFTGGINLVLIFYSFVISGSPYSLTYMVMLDITMAVVIQQQFLYFALYVSFVLKMVKVQLQKELSKILSDKDGNQVGNFTTSRINIPLESINKAIDMIGMTDKLFPDVLSKEKQKIALRIRQINKCYVLVCEVLQELSCWDGFLLFVLIIYSSCSIVLFSYSVIKLFNQGSLLSFKLLAQCLEILVFAIRVIIIVEPCHVAHEEIMKIRFLVCEIMCHVTSTSDPVFRVIDGFFHQLVLNDMSFTAMGICKIGRPLVASAFFFLTYVYNSLVKNVKNEILAVVTTLLITIFEF